MSMITNEGNRIPVKFQEDNVRLNVNFGAEIISNAQFWFGTRAEYNALPSINPHICYCIEEGT